MLTGPGGYPTTSGWAPPGTGRELDGPRRTRKSRRGDLGGRGAAAIKVSLNAEAGPTPDDGELAAIAETAHRLGLPVTAHAQGSGQVERALGAGFDELAHTPWTHRLSDDVVTDVGARGLKDRLDPSTIPSYGHDTPQIRTALDNLRRFHAAGGTVIYGTDLGNGAIPPGIHTRELQLLVEAGLEYEEVLESMVRAPLAPGAPADLLVLGADPLDDLAAFDDIRSGDWSRPRGGAPERSREARCLQAPGRRLAIGRRQTGWSPEGSGAPAGVADDVGITPEELQLAARNHGMPLEGLRYDITPIGLHYLLIHFDIPAGDADNWTVQIRGRVRSPLTLTMNDLRARPAATHTVTLECAGNGRARLHPRPLSQPWLQEAVGTAAWTGTPLGPILDEAGLHDDAVELVFEGADHGIQGDDRAGLRARVLDQPTRCARRCFSSTPSTGSRCRRSTGFRSASSSRAGTA